MESTYSMGDVLLVKKGINNYQTNDVIYLSYPYRDSTFSGIRFFQRIFGIPGDCVLIANKELYVGSYKIEDTATVKHNYFIQTKHYNPDSAFLLKYGLTEGAKVSDEYDFSYSLTNEQSKFLAEDGVVKSVTIKTEKKENFDENCFPFTRNYNWNMDHYGKLYVPKKGDVIELDTVKLYLYREIISRYEKNFLIVKKDSVFINDEYSTNYTIRQNYYFVLGDNRDNANDSRAWGFLPEDKIVGKVVGRIKKAN